MQNRAALPVPVLPAGRREEVQRERLDAEVKRLMADGKKIEAIKLVRMVLDIGLKESKEYVEKFPDGRYPSSPQWS